MARFSANGVNTPEGRLLNEIGQSEQGAEQGHGGGGDEEDIQ